MNNHDQMRYHSARHMTRFQLMTVQRCWW